MTATDTTTSAPSRTDVQAMTLVEAEALLEYLRDIPADRWNTATACDGWTIRHLVAHLTALSNQTFPNFMRRMIRHGFNFERVVDADLQRYLAPPAEMIAAFDAAIHDPSTPKPLATIALGEFMVHGEDIRRALGDRGVHPVAHVSVVAPEYVGSGKPLEGKRRATGLSLRATDGDFAWGDGPEIAGPGVDLLLAVSGRADALDSCRGDGVEMLRSRC